MSAPPIRMIRVTPAIAARIEMAPGTPLGVAAAHHQHRDHRHDGEPADVGQVPRRQQDRRAGEVAVELAEGDDRAGEGDGADGDPNGQLDQALQLDVAGLGDAVGGRRIDGGGGDETGRKPDQRVEGGHQLRHRGHVDAPGDHDADAAAQDDAARDQANGDRVKRLLVPDRVASVRPRPGPCRSCRADCHAGRSPDWRDRAAARMKRTPRNDHGRHRGDIGVPCRRFPLGPPRRTRTRDEKGQRTVSRRRIFEVDPA